MVRTVLLLLLLVVMVGLFVLPNWAVAGSTLTAASCAYADVDAKITEAVDGDTVVIPACPSGVTWTSTLTVAKSITLQGQTTGCGIANDYSTTSCNDQTIIHPNLAGHLINATPTNGTLFRITGLTISMDGGTAPMSAIQINGGDTVRIDHNNFTGMALPLLPLGSEGVIDHNHLVHNGTGAMPRAIDNVGHAAWAAAGQFGTSHFLFFENNLGNLGYAGNTDLDFINGARIVYRRNKAVSVGDHGNDSGYRASRAREIYQNHFVNGVLSDFANGYPYATNVRGGGGGYLWGNDLSLGAKAYSALTVLQVFRIADGDEEGTTYDYLAGGCHGLGPYDNNDATLFFSGTATATNTDTDTDGVSTLTDSGATFGGTNNLAINYFIHNITRGWSTQIASNTGTTITTGQSVYEARGDYLGRNWVSGDSYEVRRPTQCQDQVGRGQGALLTGYPGTPTGNVAQTLEPVYIFENILGGATEVTVSPATHVVVENTHYYKSNASFTGATGVGSGLAAARPATCTTGVGYWATDEGEWDSTNGATADGRLYECTATDTWTVAYTPYAYPHPLQGVVAYDPGSTVTGSITVTGGVSIQ